jgi:hypothetical protein
MVTAETPAARVGLVVVVGLICVALFAQTGAFDVVLATVGSLRGASGAVEGGAEVDVVATTPATTVAAATRASVVKPVAVVAGSLAVTSQPVRLAVGFNPPACGQQPNRTVVDPYKGCPIPGLNNLLYTQHNRWYCLYRDGERMTLRDRTCNKGSHEKYRFSTVLQVRYDRLETFRRWVSARKAAGQSGAVQFGNSRRSGVGGLLSSSVPTASDAEAVRTAYAHFERQMLDTTPMDPKIVPASFTAPAICWADIMEKVYPKRCTWTDIPAFYGKPDWWEARMFIDFHAEYYIVARQLLAAAIGDGVPFVALHLRRGDYLHHCTVLQKKRTPAWLAFWGVPSLLTKDGAGFHSCYPTVDQVVEVIEKVTTPMAQLRASDASSRSWRAFVLPKLAKLTPPPMIDMRHLDTLILDMVVLSLGSYFVLNRYSSFSGTVYEAATIHGRANGTNVRCW